METAATVAFYLGLIAYSGSSTLFFLDLARQGGLGSRGAWAPRVLAAGGAVHAAHIVTASLFSNVCPVDSLHFGLSFAALVAVGAYLSVYRRAHLYALGAVVAPVALTFLVAAQFVGRGVDTDSALSRPLLIAHIAANVLGVGLFVLAGASGLFYLVQERWLRQKKHEHPLAGRLPPLDTLDRATHGLLVAGFPLLTFGVVTGAAFSRELGGMHGVELVRSLLGYATWLVLATVLVLRRTAGVRGRRAAYGTLAGILCLLLVLFVYAFRTGGHA
jgi:ABC-type uncharacterized transport system permease subunit